MVIAYAFSKIRRQLDTDDEKLSFEFALCVLDLVLEFSWFFS